MSENERTHSEIRTVRDAEVDEANRNAVENEKSRGVEQVVRLRASEFKAQHFQSHRSRGIGSCSAHHKSTYKEVLANKGYIVQQTLGCGTYSKVKLAVISDNHVTPGMKVAVKIIDRQRAPLDYQNKFLPRELAIWPTLQHPHITPLLDVFQVGFISMLQ